MRELRKELLRLYFEEYNLANSNISSFNYFINYTLQDLFNDVGKDSVNILPKEISSYKGGIIAIPHLDIYQEFYPHNLPLP